MIWFYSGTPGSGKSLDVARKILFQLRIGNPVISTVDVNLEYIKGRRKNIGRFTYIPIMEITPQWLVEYAVKYNKPGKESQVLVIIDECQIIFNPREFSKKGRMDWINFFTQHRKFGYDFILVSQFDRLIDRQIRSLFEYEIKHRKANNFKWLWILPFKFFVRITVWYGMKEKISSEFFIYNKKYSKIYDSYALSSINWENDTEIKKWHPASATTDEAGTQGPPPIQENAEAVPADEIVAEAAVKKQKKLWKLINFIWLILKKPEKHEETDEITVCESESEKCG